MAKNVNESTRARDADRTIACEALDRALGDGQLTGTEHQERIAKAMQAGTLAQLRALLADLQLPGDPGRLSEPPPPPPLAARVDAGRGLIMIFATLAVGAIIGSVITRGVIGSGDVDPAATAIATGSGPGFVNSVVLPNDSLLSEAGLTHFLTEANRRVADGQVDSVSLYPEYAVMRIPQQGNPARQEILDYRGGFTSRPVETRDAKRGTVSLGTLDAPVLVGLIAGAGETLNVLEVNSLYVIIEQRDGEPSVSVYASNEIGESGYFTVRPNGDPMRIFPFVP